MQLHAWCSLSELPEIAHAETMFVHQNKLYRITPCPGSSHLPAHTTFIVGTVHLNY